MRISSAAVAAASCGSTNTSSGDATVNPPEPILPPTSTLKPGRPAADAGTSATSCDSQCVQLSRQPVIVTLSFRGRLVNAGLPSEPTINRSSSNTIVEAYKG